MNQKNQKNYQNLIDALINCNYGEEPSILITHRSLIDFDLIETIKKEISFQVEADHPGNIEFLEFLIEQLSEIVHFLDSLIDDNKIKIQQVVQFNAEDKIELLRDILLAVMLTGSDPQVMAPLLEINSSQLDEHFAQLLKNHSLYSLLISTRVGQDPV